MALEYIFVYGTLRKETATNMHYILASYCEYLADGYMQGRLYELDKYPGAVESKDSKDRVYGELYKIVSGNEILHRLDEYEGCTNRFPEPHEYIRKRLPVTLAGGDTVVAWVYVYNRDVSNRVQIKSGDYAKYLNAHGSQ